MLREWWTRLRFLMSPKPNREIDDELQFHIERQAQEYIATGMTPQEARRKAVLEFGEWRACEHNPTNSVPASSSELFFKTSATPSGSCERAVASP